MIEHVGQILKADPQNVMALAWSGEQLKEGTGEGKGALSERECTGMPCRATREREGLVTLHAVVRGPCGLTDWRLQHSPS